MRLATRKTAFPSLCFRVRVEQSESNAAVKFPESARATVSGRPLAFPGGFATANPCSSPKGPLMYHSVSAPREYSTRFLLARGAACLAPISAFP